MLLHRWKEGFSMLFENVSIGVQPCAASFTEESPVLCFQPGRVLLGTKEGVPCLPLYRQVRPLLPEGTPLTELLTVDGQAIFMPDPLGDATVPEGDGLCYGPVRLFREMDCRSGAAVTAAHHLWQWMRRNRFCGGCGGRMKHDAAERALRCPACGQVNYPMIAPAVIVALTCGDSILLAKNANSAWNHYGLVAGYVEVGETLEQAVRREVMEEVGLPVRSLRYVGSQPWGVSGSLMCAFQGEADRSLPLKIQRSELADAKWVSRDQLSAPERTVSVALEMIERFRQGRL